MDDPSPASREAEARKHSTEELFPLVYDELRRLAAQKLAQEPPGQTLQATALVHEVFVRLAGKLPSDGGWEGRTHFFFAAAEAMRRILIRRARDKKRLKRGGNRQRLDLDSLALFELAPSDELLALDEALEKLAAEDNRCAEVVKLRYFGGLTLEETAQSLGISRRTADRCWAYARAWLYKELQAAGEKIPG